MDGIVNITRDWNGNSVCIVRIIANNTLDEVEVAGYITAQNENIILANNGEFTWEITDVVLVSADDGWSLYTISPDFTSLNSFMSSGDIAGPASSVDREIILFSGTSGKAARNSGVTIDSNKNILGLKNNTTGTSFVSTDGDNTFPGTQMLPLKTITFGDANTGFLYVTPGVYTESAMQKSPCSWYGINRELTAIQIPISLNNTKWQSISQPHFDLMNVRLVNNFVISPSVEASGSRIGINECTFNDLLQVDKLTYLSISDSLMEEVIFNDNRNITLSNCVLPQGLSYVMNSAIPEVNFYFENLDFQGSDLIMNFIGIADSGVVNVTLINCVNIGDLSLSDNGTTATLNIKFDATSVSGTNVSLFTNTVKTYYTNLAIGVDPDVGFFLGSEFSWSGSTSCIFTAGRTANSTSGTDQVILGKSTAAVNEVFVWSDANGANFSPTISRTFTARATNGFGMNTASPKAFFHVKAGTTGSMLFSANAAVADADMSNSEINPYISGVSLLTKYKSNAGQSFTYCLNENFIMNPKFISNNSNYNTTSGTTITGDDFIGGIITFQPTANQSITSPTAASIESSLGARFQFPPVVSSCVNLMLVNASLFSVTITLGTGVTMANGDANIPLAAKQSRMLIVRKISTTPTYSLVG